MYHSPDLRKDADFKRNVKGLWGSGTIDQICEWTRHGRRNLSLALLDFGGRHDDQTAAGNARMLQACSHYLLVSRDGDTAGATFWDQVGSSHNLIRLGWMRSLPRGGPIPGVLNSQGAIEATFQVDIPPGDPTNDLSLEPLVTALCSMSRAPDLTPYVNLHQSGDWRISQIADVAGQAPKITELATRTGVVVLGGAAPIWAYLAGLRCVLSTRPDARVFFFDPHQPERLVEIPACQGPADEFPADALRISWRDQDDRSVLHIEISTADKFLPAAAAQNLAGAPPPPTAPSDDVAISGAGPTWLYGTYARWLIAAGIRRLASWDGRTKGFVQVWG